MTYQVNRVGPRVTLFDDRLPHVFWEQLLNEPHGLAGDDVYPVQMSVDVGPHMVHVPQRETWQLGDMQLNLFALHGAEHLS